MYNFSIMHPAMYDFSIYFSKIVQDAVPLQNHQENYFGKVQNIYNLGR